MNQRDIEVPEDFPVEAPVAGVCGEQPKLLLRRTEDGRYTNELTPQRMHERYRLCEDLAQQLAGYALNKRSEFRQWSQAHTLQQVHGGLLCKGWLSRAECDWTIQRTADLLGWERWRLAP